MGGAGGACAAAAIGSSSDSHTPATATADLCIQATVTRDNG